MSKPQLHLKTVRIDQCALPPSASQAKRLEICLPEQSYSKMILNQLLIQRIDPQSSKPRTNSEQQLSLEDYIRIKHNQQAQLQRRSGVSPQGESLRNVTKFAVAYKPTRPVYTIADHFSNYTRFPTREPTVKNSNPFKFFLNTSASKQLANEDQQIFKSKIAYVLKQSPIRRVTLSSQGSRQGRIKAPDRQRTVPLGSQRAHSLRGRRRAAEEPTPWEINNGQEYCYTTGF